MKNKLIENINVSAEVLLEDKRFSTINNLEDMWSELNKLFIEWENKIEKEHTRSYVTDHMENKFKGFAEISTGYIVASIKTLNISKEKIIKFFEHRHVGYGFYSLYENINNEEDKKLVTALKKINEEIEYERILYCSLAQYFLKFYGSFYDNEIAIRMLCKYYSEDFKLDEEEQKILVNALYRHILNAGTPSDFGKAYNGITRIAEGIENLSSEIVEKILKSYEISYIINDKVCRRQIYTIIQYSKLIEKEKYKFFYIDSICLADTFSRIIFSKYRNANKELIPRRWNSESCAELELPVFEKKNSNYKCFWIYENYASRSLKLENIIIAQINFNKDIIIKYMDNDKKITFEFDDWMLNKYDTSKFDTELEELLKEPDSNIDYTKETDSEVDNAYKQKFLFSYIYLNNYRGIEKQHLSFDHKYYYDEKENFIKLNDSNNLQIDNFYNENIYSLSCVVGKNGTGKTSVLDFLRKFFFRIINLMEGDRLKVEGNIVKLEEDLTFGNDTLKKNTDFLVIFTFNNKCYILTNMEEVQYAENKILPYYTGLLGKRNDNSKIIYFSNMIDVNDPRLFDIGQSRKINNIDSDIKEDELKSLQSFRNSDYSENLSFIKRQNMAMRLKNNDKSSKINLTRSNLKGGAGNKQNNEKTLNNDFIYQMIFLDAHSNGELIKWFGNKFDKNELSWNSIEKGSEDEEIFKVYFQGNLKEILAKENKDKYKKERELFIEVAYSPESKVEHFSSGQYAKISFLSKLYWCLKGYDEYHEKIEGFFGPNVLHVQDTLQENDTAIIVIDEGELYYHPEWQRTYISTLNDVIKGCDKKFQLQIVMTTNSPFIISDIRRKDITYLPCYHNEARCLTFGQNIHTLLKSNFFMEYTIGEFARQQIEFIIEQIKKQKKKKDEDEEKKCEYIYKTKAEIAGEFKKRFNIDNVSKENIYDYMKNMIEIIGEDIYRLKLLNMLDECMSENNISELERLEHEKLRIEEKIRNIKRGNNDSSKKL